MGIEGLYVNKNREKYKYTVTTICVEHKKYFYCGGLFGNKKYEREFKKLQDRAKFVLVAPESLVTWTE